MGRVRIFFAVLCLLLLTALLSTTVFAATINAASCSYADVSSAINSASSGDTVRVPAGTCTWNNQIVLTKGIILIGAGVGKTKITSNYDLPSGGTESPPGYLIAYDPATPRNNEPFRLSGFTIDFAGKSKGVLIYNNPGSSTIYPLTKIRIDHCDLKNPWGEDMLILIYGHVYGSIDSNNLSGGYFMFRSFGNDDASWASQTFAYGTSNNIYFEDNTIDCSTDLFIEGGAGGRYSFRHNNITVHDTFLQTFDAHGNTAASHSATMGIEVYDNLIYAPNVPAGGEIIQHRGGRGLVYNNKVISPTAYDVNVDLREEAKDSDGPGPAFSPDGQPQHVSDSYYWSNKLGTSLSNAADISIDHYRIIENVSYGGTIGNVPQWDVDGWRQTTPFTGTSGVGVGLFSARPSTCKIGVGYWATDQSKLYKCTATNTWTSYYTPYAYPHPFRTDCTNYPALCDNSTGTPAPQCTLASDCANQTCKNKACNSGTCTYTDVNASCPAASTINCGATITPTNSCGTCTGTGTKCTITGQTCNAGTCTTTQQTGTINAASCNLADVSAAINSATAGTIINVPAGSCTWTSALVITKGIQLFGAGIGNTIITGTSDRIIQFLPDSATRAAQNMFRLSGFSLRGSSFYAVIALEESNSETVPIRNIRIDHNKFENSAGYPIYIDGNFWGVVDNNQFSGASFFMFLGNQDTSWNTFYPATYGTADNLYFEDNLVDGPNFGIQSGQGGRWAWRYNRVNSPVMENPAFDQHGNQANGVYALMLSEIYENTFAFTSGVNRWEYQRGGKLLMYNNMGTSTSGSPDITVNDDVDSTSPPIQWPYDDYFFNNTWNGQRIDATEGTDAGNHITEGSTFWNQKDGFNGASGIGVGLSSVRPNSCTAGVGYWATNTKTLYKCTATNTWTLYYTPYTYPHPLRNESVTPQCIGVDSRDCTTAQGCIGRESCNAGSWSGVCEMLGFFCDSNCDGTADSCSDTACATCNCVSGSTASCYSGTLVTQNRGICKNGTRTCTAGQWGSSCVGEILPQPAEVCNADQKDENCNGVINENCECNNTETASCGTSNIGECKYGIKTCVGGHWNSCVGSIEPTTEVCADGKDNNCNGQTDEGCTTPPTSSIIDSARRIDWSNAGVAGDIPYRTTICATLSPSGGNDATAIQNAINNCAVGGVVKLNAGTFNINSGISVKSGVTLRGAGMGSTIIKNTAGGFALVGFGSGGSLSTAKDITAGNTKGSTTITTSTAHGWSVGDIILIDQLEDPTGNPPVSATGGEGFCGWCGRDTGKRPAGQLAKIVSVPSNTIAVMELPLNKNYDKTPQAVKLTGVTSNAGVEDLTLDSSAAAADYNAGIFSDSNSENSWILRVEMKQIDRIGLSMAYTYRNTIRGCTIHETLHHTSNGGYMLWMMAAGSANLIEDNIIYNALTGLIYNGALSGNVFAYNYITKMSNADYATTVWVGIASHGAHSMYTLFEGNIVDGPVIWNDDVWGSSSYTTYFRNRQKTDTTMKNALYGLQIFKDNWYDNVVGNVFGTSGFETWYDQSTDLYNMQAGIYFLDRSDPGMISTLLRHGNWDSVNKAIVWDSTISDHNIPSSLYLSSKPSWFGSLAWPAIGPDLTPMNGTIPAKQRYDALMSGSTACTAADWSYSDGLCQPSNTLTRSWVKTRDCQGGVNHTATETISCTYTQQCSDGTAYNQCSSTKPKYCNAGTLVNNCSQCGCLNGQSCQANGSCITTPQCTLASDCVDQTCKTKACTSGTCTYTNTNASCPAAGIITCGAAITPTNSCGTCTGTGTKCNVAGQTCTNNVCTTPPECTSGTIRQCSGSNVGECRSGNQTCVNGAWSTTCVGSVSPASEICDGKDNDCDGSTDENFTNKGAACSAGIGACQKTGAYVCNSQKNNTICNATAGTPSIEACDNKDNDCDGTIDENLTQNCYDGTAGTQGIGLCKAGTQTCSAGNWSSCIGQTIPTTEVCDANNYDENCNGASNEGCACTPGQTRICGTNNIGICKLGNQTCNTNAAWGNCTGAINPMNEICDNLDNDCDGIKDDGLINNSINKNGRCLNNSLICTNGFWVANSSNYSPQNETCNGLDDDCDASVDEGLGNITCGAGICMHSIASCIGGIAQTCNPLQGAVNETCSDNLDNDCDNSTDEGCICDENWACSGWSTCTDYEQTRTCTDLNNCSTTKTIPAIIQSCSLTIIGETSTGSTSTGSSSKGGGGGGIAPAKCTESWSCLTWSICEQDGFRRRSCTDDKKCGTSINKPKELETCLYLGNCNDGKMNGDEAGIDCGGRCSKACQAASGENQNSLEISVDPIKGEVLDKVNMNIVVENKGEKELRDIDIRVDKWSQESIHIDSLSPGMKENKEISISLPGNPDENSLKVEIVKNNTVLDTKNVDVDLTVPKMSLKLNKDGQNGKIYQAMIFDNRNNPAREIEVDFSVNKDKETYFVESGQKYSVGDNELFQKVDYLLANNLPPGEYEVNSAYYEEGKKIGEVTSFVVFDGNRKTFNMKYLFYALLAGIVLVSGFIFIKSFKKEV